MMVLLAWFSSRASCNPTYRGRARERERGGSAMEPTSPTTRTHTHKHTHKAKQSTTKHSKLHFLLLWPLTAVPSVTLHKQAAKAVRPHAVLAFPALRTRAANGSPSIRHAAVVAPHAPPRRPSLRHTHTVRSLAAQSSKSTCIFTCCFPLFYQRAPRLNQKIKTIKPSQSSQIKQLCVYASPA